MNPRVAEVTATDHYVLSLLFTNGEQGFFDCTSLLDFGLFKELKDISYFKKARVCNGTVVWPHEQDLCPDTLYLEATKLPSNNTKAGLGSHTPLS